MNNFRYNYSICRLEDRGNTSLRLHGVSKQELRLRSTRDPQTHKQWVRIFSKLQGNTRKQISIVTYRSCHSEWHCATVSLFISLFINNSCILPFIVAGTVIRAYKTLWKIREEWLPSWTWFYELTDQCKYVKNPENTIITK